MRTAAFGAKVLAVMFIGNSLPTQVAAQAVLHSNDAVRVISSAVAYHYEKTIARRLVASDCYFDPNVENSMRCSWASNQQGADPSQLRNAVKRNATKWCKKAGGKKCVTFWRNGRIRYKDLAPDELEKAKTVIEGIASLESEAMPLPEGKSVGEDFRNRVHELKKNYDEYRQQKRGHNPHYALCASDRGPWATFSMQGGAIDVSKVSRMCILKCKAIGAYFGNEVDCYVVVEDGRFASEAAEMAVAQ